MDDRSTKLVAAFLAILGTGLLIAIVSFAMKSKSSDEHVTVKIDELAVGEFKTLDTEAMYYFIIRPPHGDIFVVAAPKDEGAVPMPGSHWWQPIIRCKNFGLNVESVVVTNESRFVCKDAGQPTGWKSRWQWDLHGHHINGEADSEPQQEHEEIIDDMYRVRITRDDDEIAFVGLDN